MCIRGKIPFRLENSCFSLGCAFTLSYKKNGPLSFQTKGRFIVLLQCFRRLATDSEMGTGNERGDVEDVQGAVNIHLRFCFIVLYTYVKTALIGRIDICASTISVEYLTYCRCLIRRITKTKYFCTTLVSV